MIALIYQVRYQKNFKNRVNRKVKIFVEGPEDIKNDTIMVKLKESIANYGEKMSVDKVKIHEARLIMEEEVPEDVICG